MPDALELIALAQRQIHDLPEGGILKHLGLWAPRQNERAPPAGIEAALPADNVLTYYPVPGIA